MLVKYTLRAMFLAKIARPSPCYGCKKTHPISAKVFLQPREHVRYYVQK